MSGIQDLADFLIKRLDEPVIPDVRFTVTLDPEVNKRLDVMALAVGEKKSRLVPMAVNALVAELEERFNLTESDEYKNLLADSSKSPSDILYALKINGWENEF